MAARRALRVVLIATAVVAAAVLAILLAAPLVVDMPAVRAQLQRKLSESVHGRIAWDSLKVDWLPSPRGVLHNVRVEIPGRARIAIDLADAELSLAALVNRRAEIRSIQITRPVIELDLTPDTAKPAQADAGFLASYRDVVGMAVHAIRSFAPESVVSIEAGSVRVRAPDVPLIELDDLSLRAQTGDQRIDLEVTTGGSLWRRLHLVGQVEVADLSSQTKLEAIEIKPQPWLDRFVTRPAIGLALQSADLRGETRTDGRSFVQ